MKFIFGIHVNMEVFYKLILSFWVCVISKWASFQYLKKKVRDEVDFWINFKVFCKLISTLWPSTFPRNRYYHWYSRSCILKLLKVKMLHYLYNITKKEVRSWVHFLYADKHQSFYKLALSCFMEMELLKKKVSQMQNCKTFTYFTGVQPCSLLLVSQCY